METQHLTTVNIEDEMRQSYMDYAMSVIIGRALPDVRDGLKPVQRRILYAMLGEGLLSSKKHSKCAGVVGEVLKRLHPHGDMPVYDALVGLAQTWSKRYPLVDGQGNFGSIDGDPPAAYRYTECRLTALAEQMLADIDKDTVDFVPNFDDSNVEPVVLPSLVPNLLVNGADGIAVGMATHIPPHNLSEVIAGTIAFIENPDITIDELMEYIPGPDFPTGGTLHGTQPVKQAYKTGKGILKIRAKAEIETIKTGSREANAIVVTEVPYQVNKARLIEKIAELIHEKRIEGITRLRDESDRSGMRIVIELRKDCTPEVVLNQLYKLTPMQSSFGVINLAIVEGKPVVCTLHDLIRHFVNHRRDVVTRRTQFELKKASERMHLLEGFRIALLNLDDVIALIKGSETPKDAREGLMKKYSLSELQAQAILDLKLQKLTGMERLAVEKEHEQLAAEIERLKSILADMTKVDGIIVDELTRLKEKFGDSRRTEIVANGEDINIEDLIEDEEMVVTISHRGYIKRTPVGVYRSQKRGGKGVTGASNKDDDFIEHLFVTSTLADLLVFTSLGRVYWQKVYGIPETSRTARGRALVNLLRLKDTEKITAILPVREFVEGRYIVMATKRGYVKKIDLMDFARSRRSGVVACTLNPGDYLVGAALTAGDDDVILATKNGMAIRFSEKDVRPMGRAARGVTGIRMKGDDCVVGMAVVGKALGAPTENGSIVEDGTILTVCENGYGKRSRLSDYKVQGRGGKGVIDIKTDERNGSVVAVCIVTDEFGLMLITSAGKIIRFNASDVSVVGRNTRGVRLINLDEGEKVQAVAQLVERDPDD
ncbi:MAG: DNA gyrase subunit A [Candidatus Dadabacteria bacterium]|nr:MAG: DNA gyrase subunit A [Candidatus Dadabacteria bacterium]